MSGSHHVLPVWLEALLLAGMFVSAMFARNKWTQGMRDLARRLNLSYQPKEDSEDLPVQ